MTLLSFVSLRPAGTGLVPSVGTLGPQGTSSELAAQVLSGRLATDGPDPVEICLFDTYEQAGAAVQAQEVTHLVVANAYRGVNTFYMDPTLELADVFVMDTPQYGVVQRLGSGPVPPSPRIATHPSPRPIIAQLLPDTHGAYEVVEVDSTSAAARAVAAGQVELALTTQPAADLYGLEFITRTRPIRMVWSVFVAAAA